MAADRLPRELRTYRAWAKAHRLRRGVRDESFRLLVQQIMRRSLHESEGTRLLVDGESAFRAMLQAIGDAREEVLLETYIMRDDKMGESVRHALANAVKRGVRVCVLVDAVGSLETKNEFWDSIEADNVTLRHFHRLRYVPFQALRRDHRKIVVVDRAIAFTGGMNIGEEYGSSIRRHSDAWRDTFIEVSGSVARELAAVFAEGWDRAQGPPLPGLEFVTWADESTDPEPPRLSSAAAWSAHALRARMQRRLATRRDRRRGRRVRRPDEPAADKSSSTALVLDSRPGRGQKEVLAVLASLVGGARQRLWITTPYFAPPTRALALLRAAARNGVDVRLLVPGERTDVPIVRHSAHGTYRTLLEAGVRVFEYQAATLHAKTVVVDGHAGVVGSTNLDFRSFWLNAECNVLLFDDDFAYELERAFMADCANSAEITAATWSTRNWWHRVGDWFARQLRWAL